MILFYFFQKKLLMGLWLVQLGGVVFRWVLAEKQTQNLEDAEEQMAKNGDAQKKHTQIPSTVKDTCIEAETVQESLWKHKHSLLHQFQIYHHHPQHQTLTLTLTLLHHSIKNFPLTHQSLLFLLLTHSLHLLPFLLNSMPIKIHLKRVVLTLTLFFVLILLHLQGPLVLLVSQFTIT